MTSGRRARVAIACALAGLFGLAAAAPAGATDVAVDGTVLRLVDAAGDSNALDVRFNGLGYDVRDDRSRLTAGAGCAAMRPHQVVCLAKIDKVVVDAGDGADFVVLRDVAVPVQADGGPGDDLVEGGQSSDGLVGGAGNDTVVGGSGDDALNGDGGDDLMRGGNGGDRMSGGADADILEGQDGNGDVLAGGDGPDLLKGGPGNDAVYGGAGSDVLVTGAGTDTASTGTGKDKVFATSADAVTCTAGGQVQSTSAPPPAGCTALPGAATVPKVWPPPPAQSTSSQRTSPSTTASTAAAALTARAARAGPALPYGNHRGRVMSRGDGRIIGLQLPSLYTIPIRVTIRTYRKNGRLLRTFDENITSKQPVQISSRGPNRAVWTALINCCRR